jgi:hypothetical protein
MENRSFLTRRFTAVVFCAFAVTQARAASWTVTHLADDGPGSLRHAIQQAGSGDTIEFDAKARGTLRIESPLLIDKALTVRGPGPDLLAIDANGEDAFTLTGEADVELSGLSIRDAGTAVDVEEGALTLRQAVIIDNAHVGIRAGDETRVSLIDVTIRDNGGSGVECNEDAEVFLLRTAVVDNSIDNGIDNFGGRLTLVNSTLNENDNGIVVDEGSVAVYNCTIAGNHNSGIENDEGRVFVRNSVLAGQMDDNCSGRIVSGGYNLSDDESCRGAFRMNGDLNAVEALLAESEENGTVAPLAGSPMIDAADPDGCKDHRDQILTSDQRGQPRPADVNGAGARCDIGAYEVQPASRSLWSRLRGWFE